MSYNDELDAWTRSREATKRITEKMECNSGRCDPNDPYGPSHDGSTRCQSGSLASGGTRSHCTCDACY